jgi:hypothetical protein
MTFTDFKKKLIDSGLTLPKFAKIIKVSEKNLQSYKKKEKIPNYISVIVECFVIMKEENIDFEERISTLNLKKRIKKDVGFAVNPENSYSKVLKKKKKSKDEKKNLQIDKIQPIEEDESQEV